MKLTMLKTYYIDYIDNEDDLCHVWVEASSKKEAEREAKSEYWDIDEIVYVEPMN
jgi:hypothetical protein